MRLYDTARRAVVPFEPGPLVSMYVCGITPYDSTHLGHAATYLTYDLLIRRLESLGHEQLLVCDAEDGTAVTARLDPDTAAPAEGSTITLVAQAGHVHLFDPVTTERIG